MVEDLKGAIGLAEVVHESVGILKIRGTFEAAQFPAQSLPNFRKGGDEIMHLRKEVVRLPSEF